MTSALILEDGCNPSVLAAVRSLGRAGLRVGVASPQPNPRVVPSRWTHTWHEVRPAEQDLDGYVVDVRAACEAGGYDLVFGADDVELLALSARRDELPALLPHASHEAVLRAVDKLTLAEAATSVGVAVPRTVLADDQALAAVSGPVVVKSRLHWTPGTPPHPDRHLRVGISEDADAARRQVRLLAGAHAEAVLQEPLPGEQIALSLVVDAAGEVLAVSQQRTVLTSLAHTSVRAVTTPVDDALVAGAVRLLRELGWTGLVNLQYLRPPGREAHLIDLNGRFYGSLALAIAAGADLPAVWAGLELGRPPGPRQVGRPGVRFHALQTDLVRARAERRGGLPADVVGALAYAPGAAHSTWSVRDPRPALAVLGGFGRRLRPGRPRA